MKTQAQSRARELSRMHPADRRLSKGIYPKVNTATMNRGRTLPPADDMEGMTSEAIAVRAVARAVRLAKGAIL